MVTGSFYKYMMLRYEPKSPSQAHAQTQTPCGSDFNGMKSVLANAVQLNL